MAKIAAMALAVMALAVMAPGMVLCAEERGTLGKDDFVTSSIDAVFDKVGKITSGEEKIIDRDFMESDERKPSEEDALDRKMSQQVVIRTGRSMPAAAAPEGPAVPADQVKP